MMSSSCHSLDSKFTGPRTGMRSSSGSSRQRQAGTGSRLHVTYIFPEQSHVIKARIFVVHSRNHSIGLCSAS